MTYEIRWDRRESAGRVLLVAGDRDLVQSAPAEQWARGVIAACVDPDLKYLIVGGDMTGPGEWALDAAHGSGARQERWRNDGWTEWRAPHETRSSAWTRGEFWKSAALRRSIVNAEPAMVAYALQLAAKDYDVRVMELEAPWSPSDRANPLGDLARLFGLRVASFLCPNDRRPMGVR